LSTSNRKTVPTAALMAMSPLAIARSRHGR
jgi:hypothetical protein